MKLLENENRVLDALEDYYHQEGSTVPPAVADFSSERRRSKPLNPGETVTLPAVATQTEY